jgi:PUA domain protein
VDKGAIRFVVKGADIMRPGVTACEDFQEDDFVVVVDEAYSKPLAIAKSIYDSKTTKEMEEGKVFFNVHHIGDNIWNSV